MPMSLRQLRRPVHLALLAGLGLVGWAAACGGAPGLGSNSMFFVDGGAEGGKPKDSGDLHHETSTLGDANNPQPTSLVLTPPSATLIVTGNGTVTANFQLQGKLKSGQLVDLLPQSAQFTRPDLATVAKPTAASAPIVVTAPAGSSYYGGTGQLQVVYQGLSTSATVIVKVDVSSYGTGLTATSPGVIALGGGGSGGTGDGGSSDGGSSTGDGGVKDGGSGSTLPPDPAASILYPYDATVFPLGLTSPRTMWNAPQTGDVYLMHYEEQNFIYNYYFILNALPGANAIDQNTWDHLTASNNAKTATDPLAFTLSRYDSTSKKAYLTASETWTIAPESLAGAIYYWSVSRTSSTAVGFISRLQPGSGATPQQLYGGECVGCHAVNAKGTVLVGDVDDSARISADAGAAPTDPPYTNGFSTTRAWASFDITKTPAPLVKQTTEYGADLALTPDGKYVVFGGASNPTTAGSKYMSLSDLSGNVVATSGLDLMSLPGADAGPSLYTAMMPAFSPDGTKLALVISPTANDSFQDNVLPQVPTPNPDNLTESISYLAFDESVPSFNPILTTLVTSSQAPFTTLGPGGVPWTGMAYPSFTPDSSAIAFHVGQYATGCNSFDVSSPNPDVSCGDLGQDNGALFIATLANKTPIRMANADTPPVASDAYSAVEPTFNPVVRGGYAWVVFTSLREWGNQPWPGEVADAGATNSLINAKRRLWVAAVDTSIGTIDPSHPAIYLEGQTDTPNMRGFWTLSSCIATPGASGETLDGGVPADAGKPVPDGGDAGSLACTAGFQCCSGFCENGMCVDVSTVACIPEGSACTATSDCCNASVVICQQGSCVVPPPP